MTTDLTVTTSIGSLRLGRSQVLKLAYRVMLIVFWLFVLGSFFPVKFRSPEWGFQLSNTILNVSILPWLALVLRRLGFLVEQREQLDEVKEAVLEPRDDLDETDEVQSLLPVYQPDEWKSLPQSAAVTFACSPGSVSGC